MNTQNLKLTGCFTYVNSKLGIGTVLKGEVIRVTDEQASKLHEVSKVFDPETEDSWFVEAGASAKIDHDFSGEPASDEPVTDVAIHTASSARKAPAQRAVRK